jgi:hypothetical protein
MMRKLARKQTNARVQCSTLKFLIFVALGVFRTDAGVLTNHSLSVRCDPIERREVKFS